MVGEFPSLIGNWTAYRNSRLQSTLAGFLGIVVFLIPLTALIATLHRYERTSAVALAPYYLWVLYDLVWTFELWRLNGG